MISRSNRAREGGRFRIHRPLELVVSSRSFTETRPALIEGRYNLGEGEWQAGLPMGFRLSSQPGLAG